MQPEFLPTEPGELGKQRGRVDFDDQSTVTETDDLAVLAFGFGQHLIERLVEAATLSPLPGLDKDAAQQVRCFFRFGQAYFPCQAPLIGMTT